MQDWMHPTCSCAWMGESLAITPSQNCNRAAWTWCNGECWPSCTEEGRHDRHVHPPLRGGRVETGWQSHSLSERSRRRVGDLGAWLARRGGGGSDAAGAAAAWYAVRRCGGILRRVSGARLALFLGLGTRSVSLAFSSPQFTLQQTEAQHLKLVLCYGTRSPFVLHHGDGGAGLRPWQPRWSSPRMRLPQRRPHLVVV